MPGIWSLCDLSIVHLKNEPLFEQAIPSKIFESMAIGLPMIVGWPENEATEIIRQTKSGEIIELENAQAMADKISKLYSNRERWKELYESALVNADRYDRSGLANKMLACLKATI